MIKRAKTCPRQDDITTWVGAIVDTRDRDYPFGETGKVIDVRETEDGLYEVMLESKFRFDPRLRDGRSMISSDKDLILVQ